MPGLDILDGAEPEHALREFLPLAAALSRRSERRATQAAARLAAGRRMAAEAIGTGAAFVAEIPVEQAPALGCCLRADRQAGLVTLNSCILEPCWVDSPDCRLSLDYVGTALAAALIIAGWQFVAGGEAMTDAEIAARGLRFAGPYGERLLRLLGDPARFARPLSPATASRLRDDRQLELLAGDNAYDRERAFRFLRRSSDLTLLPRLQELFAAARSEAAASIIVKTHRAVAVNAYSVEMPSAETVIRRSTLEGRLQALDAVIVDLLTRLAHGESCCGDIDLDALRGDGAKREVVIADMAAADGTTTLELFTAIEAAAKDIAPLQVRIAGSDVAPWLYLVPDAESVSVFAADGRLLQRKVDGAPHPPGDDDHHLRQRFKAMPDAERTRHRVAWINPKLAALLMRYPDVLSFDRHDIFDPLPRPVDMIRIFGILYTRIHDDVDADSYYRPDQIAAGLVSAGGSLRAGGVLLAGNYVDCIDRPERYLDYEIWQRGCGAAASRLVLRRRVGQGLGIGRDALPL